MKIMIYAQELLSVALTPFVLWLSLPDCAPAIVDFFREFTIHVDTLGYVCSFAVFDFKRHGNVKVSLNLILASDSFIGTGIFPWLPLSTLSITTPRSMIFSWIFGVCVLMEEMGILKIICNSKSFSFTSFHVLVRCAYASE